MNEYIKKYPESESDIMALAYSLGEDKANEICKKALSENKVVSLITKAGSPDFLDYKLK